MKPKSKLSIKWKIYISLLIFATVILAVMWLGTVVFIDDIYRVVATNKTVSVAGEIAESYLAGNTEEINKYANENNASIVITDIYGNKLINYYTRSASLVNYSEKNILRLSRKALISGGSYYEYKYEMGLSYRDDEKKGAPHDSSLFPNETDIDKNAAKSLIYVLNVKDNEGNDLFIFVNTLLVPITATANTVKLILFITSGITVCVALLAAVLISKSIVKPIEKISIGAKRLAEGDYEVSFGVNGYAEIDDLANVMNYTTSELKKVETLQRELIANVSHDLRTPLTLISGYAEMMRDIPGEANEENIAVIIGETNRLERLVADMLDISKLQADATQLNLCETDLAAMIVEALQDYGRLIEANGVKIDFVNTAQPQTVKIMADKKLLTQALYNLINNAINYCGADQTVIVKLSCEGECARVSVIDHGCGIDPALMENIWERYYRDTSSHKRPVAGTGLGLSIVKSVFIKHGYSYGVESKLGYGSEFWFSAKIL